jgi:regulator of protease activity HflC (stomatin/prohibitin superfamily)
MVRVLVLIVSALVTLPILNVAYALLSATSDLRVAAGCAMMIGIGVGWYGVLPYTLHLTASQMRRWFGAVLLFLAVTSLTACGRTIVEPGHVGIQVDYYGQDRGVESYPKVTGVVWYNPITTKVLQYPTFVQTAVWTHNINEGNPIDESISFTTADQMQVSADVSLAYHLTADRVPAFYVKFRSDDLRTFTHGFLRNLAREKFDAAAGRYKIEQIMGDNAPFLKDARTMLQQDLDPIGVQLDQFGLIGAPRPPQQVIDAINAKVQATQNAIRVENEVRQAKAQAEKNVAEAEGQARAAIARAEGDAKANQVLSSSITPTLVEWRKLEIQQHAIEKWNGTLPTYAGSAVPFLSLPTQTPASH